MIRRKTWNEFQESGLLWFVNMILHAFGWAIIFERVGNTLNVYPARVSYRGFDEDTNTNRYMKLAEYMKDNAEEVLHEVGDSND